MGESPGTMGGRKMYHRPTATGAVGARLARASLAGDTQTPATAVPSVPRNSLRVQSFIILHPGARILTQNKLTRKANGTRRRPRPELPEEERALSIPKTKIAPSDLTS